MFKKTCRRLAKKNLTICFLESASAGYLSYKFSLSPDSGKILMGSLVCYDLSIKTNILKISPSFIKKYTPESMQVTEKMLKQGKKLFNADLYLACTGLLKQGGSETKEKPVGTFFYCIGYKNKIYYFHSIYHGTPNKKLEQLLRDISQNIIKIIE